MILIRDNNVDWKEKKKKKFQKELDLLGDSGIIGSNS